MANQTIYPYGAGGQLPSSIGVVNDLRTGGADKALSAEMGKFLGGLINRTTEIDLTAFTAVGAVIANSGKWIDGTSTNLYACLFIPITAGGTYTIKANQTYATPYALLTNNSHTNGTNPSYATGYSAVGSVSANTEVTFVAPLDATYLYILVNNEGNTMPQYVKSQEAKTVTEQIQSAIINDLLTGGADKALSAEMGKELAKRLTLEHLDLEDYPTTDWFIATTLNKWTKGYESYASKFIPLTPGLTYYLTANSENGFGYAILTSDEPVYGATPSYDVGYTKTELCPAGSSVEISTETVGAKLYFYVFTTVDATPSDVSIVSDKDVSTMILDYIKSTSETKSKIPAKLIMGERGVLTPSGNRENVIYTIDDFMLAHDYESGSDGNLKFSNDLGKTWTTVANTFGTIVNAFMFADGTFMMGCKQSDGCRIYWTRDFATFAEATVYDMDADGNHVAYTPVANTTRFHILNPKSYHSYVNGVEHYCFWDYIIDTTKPRMWYAISDENGVTVRAAFAFGVTKLDGSVVPARHGHGFEYNKHDGFFYAFTGDAVNECHIMRGKYVDNNGVHVWTWEKLATGGGYKLITPFFDEGNVYAVTDYTETELANYKGIVSIPIDKIALTKSIDGVIAPAKIRYWFHATAAFMAEGSNNPNNPCAITGYFVESHGWRCGTPDYLGGTKLLVAKDGHNFAWIPNDGGYQFGYIYGPNNQGDVLITAGTPGGSVAGEGWLRISHKRPFNLTEIMRRSGATDFCENAFVTPY